ncbi:ABC transporter permease [Marinicellulosiphila megalodicopiae]|uniref:ABC transporter permease n=1 Tax=Marinicellulosiphila megalodicopiae TaxID=2724896 RepID=UPI003BAFB6AF
MWIQFKKEMLELFRDKKNLLLTIIIPIVFMPLLMVASIFLGTHVAKNELEKTKYYMLSEEIPLFFKEHLNQMNNFELLDFNEDYPNLIKQKKLSFALSFKKNEFEIFYNASDLISDSTQSVQRIINQLNQLHTQNTLKELGLNDQQQADLLNQYSLIQTNLASKEQISTKAIGGVLPFLAIVIMCISAVATSCDICAGEKERQTMETLLLSPNGLLNMLLGKWISITVFSLISGFLMLLSFSVGVIIVKSFLNIEEIKQFFTIMTVRNIIMTMIILIPASGIISALLLTTSSLASSFKEAQSYGSMALMLILAPQGIAISGLLEINNQSQFYPLINLSLWLQSFFNQSPNYMYLLPILLINLFLIGVLIVIAFSLYKNERIIFSQ